MLFQFNLKRVCATLLQLQLHHHSYINGTVLERFDGPNASAHCCASCAMNKSAACDGWRIEGTGIAGSCVTFKKGTTRSISNPSTAIVSASAITGGGWHRRQNNCSAWQPTAGGTGAELGTFEDFELTLLAMLHYNNQTSPARNLARLLAATFLPWNTSNNPTYLPPPPGAPPAPPAVFFDAELWYWEANTAGALSYPDAIQLVIGSFGELFGTDFGTQLQAWCIRWGWPLVSGCDGWRQAVAVVQLRRDVIIAMPCRTLPDCIPLRCRRCGRPARTRTAGTSGRPARTAFPWAARPCRLAGCSTR